MSKGLKVTLLVILVLILDQASKIWVKTHMGYGEEIMLIGNWARLHFTENPGMAFGLELPEPFGKLILSLFRIVAVGGLIYYIRLLQKEGASFGLLCSFALILAGAIGNIIDSAIYGLIFSASGYHYSGLATMFPEGGGYAGFLYGKVVDMLYFPMFSGHFPDWFPVWGGEPYLFFRPVFNIADVAITTGVLSIIVFHRGFFTTHDKPIEPKESGANTVITDTISEVESEIKEASNDESAGEEKV